MRRCIDQRCNRGDRSIALAERLGAKHDEDAPLTTEAMRNSIQANFAALAMLSEPGASPQIVRSGETSLRATITDRVAPGVVYTTFHHPGTQANVITTDYSDWATNCPEYKVTAVQVSPSNGPTDWQEDYAAQAERSRRILPAAE